MSRPPQFVSPADFEALLADLQTLPGNNREGFFGPDSVTWRLNRESALFLGAGRAALLQVAHPWVAASLAQHSHLLEDAIGRFHSTFRVIYTMVFGTRAQALAASRQLYRRHTSIRGELPADVGAHRAHEHYEANEVNALRWVYATLIQGAVLAYEFALPPLPPATREAYYVESRRLAALWAIPAEALPGSWNAFDDYVDEILASPVLAVDDKARRLGQTVLAGVGTWVQPPHWYRALTAFWLPPRLREAFALPFGPGEQRALAAAARWLPRLYPAVPKPLRFVGPYHEARDRLAGRTPGAFTERSNRFWMGQPRLLYRESSE